MKDTILAVGKELSKSSSVAVLEQKLHYKLHYVETPSEAINWLQARPEKCSDLVLLDIHCFDEKAENNIRTIRGVSPATPLITLVPYGNETDARRAMSAGATDFITKPATLERLRHTIQMAIKIRQMSHYNAWLERRISGHVDFSDLVGNHPRFLEVINIAQQAAHNQMPVWIEGETGAGKKTLAHAIHGGGQRADKRFVIVNCRIISASMLEMLLFGQVPEQGYRQGKLSEAHNGTLLLEEPEALPHSLQQRLADWLDAGCVMQEAGGAKTKLNVRIICSSIANNASLPLNKKLSLALKSICISMPPLLQRSSDVVLLAEHFLAQFSASKMKYIRGLTPPAMQWLQEQRWHGNIQQLSDLLLNTVSATQNEWLGRDDFIESFTKNHTQNHTKNSADSIMLSVNGKVKTLRSLQEEAIRFALRSSGGCMSRTAKSLGIGRSTLYRKLDEFNIDDYISRANQTMRPTIMVSSTDRS